MASEQNGDRAARPGRAEQMETGSGSRADGHEVTRGTSDSPDQPGTESEAERQRRHEAEQIGE